MIPVVLYFEVLRATSSAMLNIDIKCSFSGYVLEQKTDIWIASLEIVKKKHAVVHMFL